MNECCATCAKRYKLRISNYHERGCRTVDADGFVCMAFASCGYATWMNGISPESGRCECWTEKKREYDTEECE